jgi:hypothetical protein
VTTDRQPPHHNTLTCYVNYGCRLPACIDRYRAYNRSRDAAKKAGQWQPHVDAEPIRQHLRMLNQHGITLHRAAEIAGIGPRSLHPLFQPQNGRRRRHQHTVRAELAEKILAIQPEKTVPGKVDPTGTARRIQACVAIGWPMSYLAPHFNLSDTYIHQLIQRSSKDCLVLATTAAKVADGYERVKTKKPHKHGIRPLDITRARNMAATRGWPPPKYWATRMDVIDDPHFTPEYKVKVADLLTEEATFMANVACLSRDEIATRLGRDRWYIDRLLDGPDQNDMEAAA